MPLTRAMAAGKTAVPSNSRSGQSNETSDEAPVEGQPPHKRARVATTRAPKRPKKASLSRLLDMPPEVFNEIATHLLPADLLSLARSAKLFRNIFMSRTSEHLWKQSLANNPSIPDCPPQLSEPYYVSLLFSKTCSECGTKVFRRMDPYLYVRLCTPCRDAQIIEISLLDSIAPTLPVSDVIKEPRFGYGYTLRSELAQLVALAGPAVEDKNREWREERMAEIEERREHSEILEEYLDMVEEERELEIDNLKAQRREQIETRLLEGGWTKQSIKPSPDTSAEWNKLVSQPKPLTDRIWNNLYPKLVPLLNSNRSYNIELDKKNRRRDCIRKLQALVSSIRMSLPPLVHLVRKTPLTDDETPAPATPSPSSATSNSDIKVEQPFPSINELLTWPIIKSIVDDDISPEQVETKFGEIRDEFDQAVLEWRDKIERDLVAVWDAGREEETAVESTSKGKGKGKAVARTTKTRARKTRTSAGSSSSASTSAVELALPEFVATYTKPDGTSTTLLSDLSPNLQLLLRADTVFGPAYSHDYVLNRTYPAIVPRADPLGLILGGSDELNYGDRWDPDRVKRDDEMSAVAKKMLARVGRPDATSVEMKALGTNFKCGRCNRTLTNSWEDLVVHYAVEEKRHRQAQEKIRDEPGRGFIFHTTHGLDSPNPRPFAHLMTPQESAEYVFQASIQHSPMTTCMKCQAMGIEARYFHTFAPGFESPIIEHLRDVHDVMVAQPIIDFQGWYGAPHFFDSDSEEDSGSEEEWEILDFH